MEPVKIGIDDPLIFRTAPQIFQNILDLFPVQYVF